MPRSASAGSACEEIQAGTMPKMTPVASESRNAKPSTIGEGLAWMGICVASGKARVKIMRAPAYAMPIPMMPPATERIRLSIKHLADQDGARSSETRCESKSQLGGPFPWRARRLAMFAHATSNTRAEIAT